MGKKSTKEEVIDKANKVHNWFYGYSKMVYINTHTPVIISCPVHGDFTQAPSKHLKGRGCFKCACERSLDFQKGKLRLGEKHMTKEGYEIEIIEYKNNLDCTVMFTDTGITKNATYQRVINGGIRNPYHKSILGIGYHGFGIFSTKLNKNAYYCWLGMLSRCYSLDNRNPTYKDVTVCEEWHDFQNFAKWFDENWNIDFMDNNWNLDKDIICPDCRVYSPDTCAFVPAKINTLFIRNKKGNFPIGVTPSSKRYSASISGKYIGHFKTPEEAFNAYKIAKEEYVREIADKWKDLIDSRVYEAMYNYQVGITD